MTRPKPSRNRTPPGSRRSGPGPGGADAQVPGGSRRTASQARSRETVEAILEAAARLLEEQGFRGASTNAIARRAGVSIGSLYQYFDSREDVFRALVARHTGEVHGQVQAALAPVLQGLRPAVEVLPEFLQALIRRHQDRPALMEAMATQLAHLATPEERRREAQAMAAWVAQMAERLPGRPDTARARSWMAAELTAHLARRLAHEPPPDLPLGTLLAVYRELVDRLLG